MGETHNPIAQFQRHRKLALIGLLLLTLSLLFAFLNEKMGVVSTPLAWGLFGISVLFCGLAGARYRCPYCHHFPEAEIPLFDPVCCCKCGASLRQESVSGNPHAYSYRNGSDGYL
jgi:hypothetical protein